jgi:hypothetical protein
MYLKKEFRTFLVKIEPNLLASIASPLFDFTSLNYIDISKEVKQSLAHPKSVILGYLFDSFKDIPEQVLNLFNLDK